MIEFFLKKNTAFRIRYWDMATEKTNLFSTFVTNLQSYNYNKLSNFLALVVA